MSKPSQSPPTSQTKSILEAARALCELRVDASRLFDLTRGWADSIQMSNTPTSTRIERDGDLSARYSPPDMIQRRLGHISANPHDVHNAALLSCGYSYSSGEHSTLEGYIIANRSREIVDEFLGRLVGAAKAARTVITSPDLPDSSGALRGQNLHFILLGGKGSGKTFFLNHLLCSQHDKLNEQSVVWVRMNLVAERNFDDDLRHWAQAQAAKILLRYYDENSEIQTNSTQPRLDLYKHVKTMIKRKYEGAEKADYVAQLDSMQFEFGSNGTNNTISPTLCPRLICGLLIKRAQYLGLSFIFVCDGYDRLEIEPQSNEKFLKLTVQLRGLTNNEDSIGGAILIVTRSSTFDQHKSVDPFRQIVDRNIYAIAAVPVSDVLSARVSAIKAEIPKLADRFKGAWLSQDWAITLEAFLNSVRKEGNRDDVLDRLDATFHQNNRAKVQILQFQFQQFLQEATGKGYKLLEQMVRAGFDFPPVFYRYDVNNNFVVMAVDNHGGFDNRFVPLINRAPLPNSLDNIKPTDRAKWLRFDSCLLGLRIIQILQSHENHRKTAHHNVDHATVGELVLILSQAFDYDPLQIRYMLSELANFEVLNLRAVDFEILPSLIASVELLPK